MRASKPGGRTLEQLREQYEVERQLASRLKQSTREERKTLYGAVYDELYSRVPHHPQLTRKAKEASELREKQVQGLVELASRFVTSDTTFLEIGAGDCALSLKMARRARRVYALDVSEQISRNDAPPENFRLILSDGCSVPVEPGTVSMAFSNQLLEHLHPEDALDQLRNVRAALVPKGVYVCITPSSLSGPHDISQYFEDEPTGFHLKEYSTGELVRLFRQAGFSRFRLFFWSHGMFLRIPAAPIVLLESLLRTLPRSWQRRLAHCYPLRRLLGNFIAER